MASLGIIPVKVHGTSKAPPRPRLSKGNLHLTWRSASRNQFSWASGPQVLPDERSRQPVAAKFPTKTPNGGEPEPGPAGIGSEPGLAL